MYRFETIYTKDNIKILIRAQVHAYYWKHMMTALFIGIFLVVISVTYISSRQLAVFLTAAGCWLCISPSYPVQYLTRKIHKKMGNDNRKFVYVLRQNEVSIESGSNRNHISYHQIQKIIETKGAFCVFLTPDSGFLLSKADLQDTYAAGIFKEDIKERTGILIEQEQPLFLRLMKLRLIKNRV